MSHLLHEYISHQLAGHLRDRRVVVWFDPRAEFVGYVRELYGDEESLAPVDVDGVEASLARCGGSLYELRAKVEPLVAVDEPAPLVVYAPNLESSEGSPLKELELAGRSWTPQLRKLARNALRARFTDGVIDDLLAPTNVSYNDLVAATSNTGDEPPSVLKTLLAGSTGEMQLASWLADPDVDQAIVDKESAGELARLVSARLGVDLLGDDLSKWRSVVSRFVLATEFRSDLDGEAPHQLDAVPAGTQDVVARARAIADRLRAAHPDRYPALADLAERELNLDAAAIDPLLLGSIDTFRFEERELLKRCSELRLS